MAEDIKLIGKRLREFRELNNMTREQFCEKMDIDSYHWGTIERGERNISLQRLLQVGEVFGVDVRQFLPENDSEQDNIVDTTKITALLAELNKRQLLVLEKFITDIIPYM